LVGDLPVPVNAEAPALALVTGVIILADWLVSQEAFLEKRLQRLSADATPSTVAAHFAQTRSLIPGLLTDAGLNSPRPVSLAAAFEAAVRPGHEGSGFAAPTRQKLDDYTRKVYQLIGTGKLRHHGHASIADKEYENLGPRVESFEQLIGEAAAAERQP
jgi:hypothetical protein